MKYVVEVTFWNIDMEYEWKNIYVSRNKPTRRWMSNLYEGVNEPKKFRILGQCVPLDCMIVTNDVPPDHYVELGI